MPKKLLSCIKAKGGPNAEYAWPICISSTKLHPHYYNHKKKGGK